MDKMTPTETLARLADAATPGDWRVSGDMIINGMENIAEVCQLDKSTRGGSKEANAEYLAAVQPKAIKSLLARIERQDRALNVAGVALADIETYDGKRSGFMDRASHAIRQINAILGGENTKRSNDL